MAVADEIRNIYHDEDFDYAPSSDSPPNVSSNLTSEAARKLQEAIRVHSPSFSSETPRPRRQSKKSSLSTLLLLTTERLSQSNSRVSELESRVSALLDLLKQITLARDNAAGQVARLSDELSHYKIQFEKAQQEIFKADDIIRRLTERNREAEEDSSRHRERLRKMLEEKSIALAREEGRRAGFREGWIRAEKEVRLLEGSRFPPGSENVDSVDGISSSEPGLTTSGTTSSGFSRRTGRSRDRSAPPPTQRRHTSEATVPPKTANQNQGIPRPATSEPISAATRSTTPPGIPLSISKPQPNVTTTQSSSPELITPITPTNPPPRRPSQSGSTAQRPEFVAPPDNFIPISVNQRIGLPPPHEMNRPVSLRDLRDQLRTPAPEPPIVVETVPNGPPIVQIPTTPRDTGRGKPREAPPFPHREDGYDAPTYQAASVPSGPRPPPVIPALDENREVESTVQTRSKPSFRSQGRWPGRSRRASTAASTRISDYDLLGTPYKPPPEREEVTEKRSLEKVAQWRGTLGGGAGPPEPVILTISGERSGHMEAPTQPQYPPTAQQPPVVPNLHPSHPPHMYANQHPPPPVVPPRSRPGSPINWLRSAFKTRGRMNSSNNTIPIAVQSPSEATSAGSLTGPHHPNRELLTPEPQTLITPSIQEYIQERISPKLQEGSSALPDSRVTGNLQNLPPGFVPLTPPATSSEPLYFNGDGPGSPSESIFIAPESTSSKSIKTSFKPIRPQLTYEEAPSPSSPPVLVYPDRIVRPSSVNPGSQGQATRGRGASFDAGVFGSSGGSRADRGGGREYYGADSKGKGVSRQRAMSVGSSTASAPLARPFSIFDD